jgi:glucose-6-phosphate 1-dehydrogenase
MAAAATDPTLTDAGAALTIFVIGASGDLACKKTYPSLYELFLLELLPPLTSVVGYARSASTDDAMRAKWGGFLKAGTDAQRAAFLSLCTYRAGGYDDEAAFGKAAAECTGLEAARSASGRANRVFYFAIPPSVFEASAKTVSNAGRSGTGWNRIVVEKPFGRDSDSSAALGRALAQYFDESSIYRIDQ